MLHTASTRLGIEPFTAKGISLSNEDRATLSMSLLSLQGSQSFDWVRFWGKLVTLENSRDYYVATAGHDADPFAQTIFICQDAMSWLQAPTVTDEEVGIAVELRSNFMGDPAFEHPVPPARDGTPRPTLSEAKRVAAIVQAVQREVTVVPRGAYYQDALGKLRPNQTFVGVRAHELTHLTSYVHFRPPSAPPTDKQLARADYEESLDVLDTIEGDAPKGCWTVEARPMMVLLSSLVWPGYHHYASAVGGGFGSIYVGSGRKNHDLGFMI
ncbi:hypothetical protein H9P43_001425 [Blastocladiella emersonii ATCC 22665]|nr:hypothetical protein H9P43_001425 [Blastocladiella emersonii ATCC 22665]